MSKHMTILFVSKATEAVNEFWTKVAEFQTSCAPTPPSNEDVVKSWIADPILQSQLMGTGAVEWKRVVKEEWFNNEGYFGPEENGDILCQVCSSNSTEIKQAAKTLLDKNHANSADFSIEFPAEGEPKVLLSGKKTAKIKMNFVVDFQGEGDVPAVAAAGLSADFPIDVSHKVLSKF